MNCGDQAPAQLDRGIDLAYLSGFVTGFAAAIATVLLASAWWHR